MTEVLSEHNLMTVENLTDLLSATDAIEPMPFEYGGEAKVSVEYQPENPVDKLFLVFGNRDPETGVADEYALTRDSAEQLFKQVKLPPALLESVPLEYTMPVLNWFLENQPGSLKALLVPTATGKKVSSFCRVGTEIYPATEILDTILSTLRNEYGITEVLVNNAVHDLSFTNYTLIFPQTSEQVEGTGDVLMSGLNVQTSTLGLKPTMINGVVARDYHFNAMVSTTAVAQWNRKQAKSTSMEEIVEGGENSYDIFDWLKETVIALHTHRNDDLVNVKRLRKLSLAGHANELMSDVFAKFSIPVGTRNLIRLNYADQEEQSYLGLWNAITETANEDEVQEKPTLVRKLMEVGGELAHHPSACGSCHRLTELD